MKKSYLILLVLLSFSSCGTTSLIEHNNNQIKKAREFWIGQSKSTLILNLGKPYEIYSDGEDGKVYRYKKYNGFITWVTDYYINSNDQIYHLNAHSTR